jgi:hypothetical protein
MFPECEDPDIRWTLNNALKFWRACPTRRCRRARSCVGDDQRCHAIFWPVVPEEAKVFWRAALDALHDNRSASQAERLADAAAARFRRRQSIDTKIAAVEMICDRDFSPN